MGETPTENQPDRGKLTRPRKTKPTGENPADRKIKTKE